MNTFHKISRRLANVTACAVFIAGAFILTPSISSAASTIKVENFTGFDDLTGYVNSALNAKLKAEIQKRGLAVFVTNIAFPGTRACYAVAGLTTPAGKDRNARFPARWVSSFRTMPAEAWDESGCRTLETKSVIETLNRTEAKTLLADWEQTKATGTYRKEAPDSSRAALSTQGIPDSVRSKASARVFAHKVESVFEYRQVQTSVFADGVKFDSGLIMCVAFAGITGRNPEDKTSRWPEVSASFVRQQEGGDIEGCKGIVVPQAVDGLYSKSWTENDLLKDFSRVREDGIPMPNAAKAAQLKAAQPPVQRANEQTKRESLFEKRARDYEEGRIICTNERFQSSLDESRRAAKFSDEWMAVEGCNYRR